MDSLNVFGLKRSQYLAKKYGSIWKEKINLKKLAFESQVSKYKSRLNSKNITESKSGNIRMRPAPRMPKFMIESLQNDIVSVSEQNLKRPTLPIIETTKDFCTQTEIPVQKQEAFYRIDSGIDVHVPDQKEKEEFDKDGARLMLEKIAAGLFEKGPLDKHEMFLQKEPFSITTDPIADDIYMNSKTIVEMEKKLLEFQESKSRHKKNVERLGIVKNEVDAILMDPKCSSRMLKDKIQEIESLGREISHYKENIGIRKHDLDSLSQKLLLLIQKNRHQII